MTGYGSSRASMPSRMMSEEEVPVEVAVAHVRVPGQLRSLLVEVADGPLADLGVFPRMGAIAALGGDEAGPGAAAADRAVTPR
jgi:hypothetical protein